MKREFVYSPDIYESISLIQSQLKQDCFTNLRIIGEPGIGKTRIVLESLIPFKSLVTYFESPSVLENSTFYQLIQNPDNQFHCVLVVDECDSTKCRKLLNKLSGNNKIKLITIHNEMDEEMIESEYVTVNPLGKQELIKVLMAYNIDKVRAETYASFCEGSPQVAHCIGENLKKNPEDLLKTPSMVEVWDRFISDYDDEKDDFRDRKFVLENISLFKKFGYKGEFKSEFSQVFRIINEKDSQLTLKKFNDIVNKLRSRKILRGDFTLHLSPKALHIKMWTQYWKEYGNLFDYNEFLDKMKEHPELTKWFIQMFEYSNSSVEAKNIIKNFIQQVTREKKFDSILHLLPWLATGNQEITLKLIESYLQDKDLLQIDRRSIVNSLEIITYTPHLFDRAARLLLKLAGKENERISNNSTGIFTELFHHFAKTEASLDQKLTLLRELIDSDKGLEQRVVIAACDKALKNHFVLNNYKQIIGFKEAKIIRNNNEEIGAYQLEILNLLFDRISKSEGEIRKIMLDCVLDNSETLIVNPSIKTALIEFYENLSYTDSEKKSMIITLNDLIKSSSLSKGESEVFENILKRINGITRSEKLRRYAGLQIPYEDYDDTSNKLEELARYYIANINELISELPWLLNSKAENAFQFGIQLGQLDTKKELFDLILSYQKKYLEDIDLRLLAGYIRGNTNNEQNLVNDFLNNIYHDTDLRKYLPYLSSVCGIDDDIGEKLLELAESEIIRINQLSWLTNSIYLKNISEPIFNKWMNQMLLNSDETIWHAMDLFDAYYCRRNKSKMPLELTLSLLSNNAYFAVNEDDVVIPIPSWIDVADSFFKQNYQSQDSRVNELIKKMTINLGNPHSIMCSSYVIGLLIKLTTQYPDLVWKTLTENNDGNLVIIFLVYSQNEDLIENSNKKNILTLVDSKQVYEWIDKDKSNRSTLISRFLPKTPFSSEKICPRNMLILYGDIENVKKELASNFLSGSLDKICDIAEELKPIYESEENINVRDWLKIIIDEIDGIKLNIIQLEEREF